MWIIRWILGALLIIVVLGFALQNQEQTVSVQVMKWQSPVMPLYFFLYLAFIAGLVTWLLFSTLNILKAKGENLGLQREIKRLKAELDRMRNAGIDDDSEPDRAEKALPAPGKENETATD